MDIVIASGEPPKVQHVTKKSSDQLLSKFAELGDSNNAPKKNEKRRSQDCGTTLVDRRSLLPSPATRKTVILRRFPIARAHLRARDFRNKSLLGTIHKTWRRTVEVASRVLLERHYHRHKRLINDIV